MNKYTKIKPGFKKILRNLKKTKIGIIVENYTFYPKKKCEGCVKNSLKG